MFAFLRRALLSVAIVCCMGLGNYHYGDHSEQWFESKFVELHTNAKHQFTVVSKETVISPPDDKWSAKLSISILFKKGQDIRREMPYMVVLRALDPMPAEAVPILVRYLATKNYGPGTALVWLRWDSAKDITQWVLVGPPDSFIAETIFKVPPMETQET